MAYRTSAPLTILYLSFADDIVIFANEDRANLRRIMDFLHHYEILPGQMINQAKGSFYLASIASASRQIIIYSVTGFSDDLSRVPHLYGAPKVLLF